jgi:hypothetical protein
MRKLFLVVGSALAIAVSASTVASAALISLGPGLSASVTAGQVVISASVLPPATVQVILANAHSSSCSAYSLFATFGNPSCVAWAPVYAGTATKPQFTNVAANTHASALGAAAYNEEQLVYNPYDGDYVLVTTNSCGHAFGCHDSYTIDYKNSGTLSTHAYDFAAWATNSVGATLETTLNSTKVAGGGLLP